MPDDDAKAGDAAPVEEEAGFDAAAAAAEYEAQNAGRELNTDTGEPAQEEPKPAEAAAASAPKAVEPQADDDPDDTKFLESSKGKPIPYEAFVKKNEKWKKRHQEALQKALKLEQDFEAHKKTQPLAPDQVARYENLGKVFGNLDKAAVKYPWLREALMDIGRGKDPDWRVLHQALDGHVKALPNADPVLLRRMEAIEEANRQFKDAEFNRGLQAHVLNENAEIDKFFNGNPDEELKNLVNNFATQMVPETGDISNLPKRTEMAKNLLAWSDKRAEAKIQEALKQRVPEKPVRQAGLRAGNGPAAAPADNDDPPPYGTDEYYAWIAKKPVKA